MEAEGCLIGRRYSLILCESISWVRPDIGLTPLCEHKCESYFSLVIATKKVPLKTLKDYQSDLLTITPEEQALGFKYVFQTKLTKETVGERLRGPLGMFDTKETFTDNNAQLVMNRLHSYYGE